jgi:hypothetical protein
MRIGPKVILAASLMALAAAAVARENGVRSATVPFILDHNRMVVEAEIQGKDGAWHKARLWVDTGNPSFLISKPLAERLGIEVSAVRPQPGVPTPENVRIGGMPLDLTGVKTNVGLEIDWMFMAIGNDGNFPSTVLKKYHVVFDYPARQMILAEPGVLEPRGIRSAAAVHPTTGIVQLDAEIAGEKFSLALDNGASSSYIPDSLVAKFHESHPEWPYSRGAVGSANIWGWWPGEGSWPMARVPELRWGGVTFSNTVVVGLPQFGEGMDVGKWYSQKTAHPVQGFLGPNAFRDYRVEIVYPESAVYFEKGPASVARDMDIVRLTVKPLNDGRYEVVGVVGPDGGLVVDGVESGDILLQVGDVPATGATMGTVVDALRGKPGDVRILKLERKGKPFTVETRVERVI